MAAIPTGWAPQHASTRRTIRFFVEGTANLATYDTAFAYYFKDDTGANTFEVMPAVKPGQANTTGGYQHGETVDNPTVIPATPVGGAGHIWCNTIRIKNDGAGELFFSFDGVNDQGHLKTGEEFIYRNRIEAGICVRCLNGATPAVFRIEAW